MSRIDDAHSDKVDRVRHEFVDESLGRVADHFTGVELALLISPRLNLVTLEVT